MDRAAYLARPDALPTRNPDVTFEFNLTTHSWSPGKYRNVCKDMTEEEKHVLFQLHIIHLVFASLSVAGAISIIVYSVWRRSVRTPEVRPLFHLTVSDVCLALCWIIGAALWDRPMYYMSYNACTILQAVTEMFNVTSFYLTANYALNVYVRLKDRLHKAEGQPLLMSSTKMPHILKLVTFLSWFIPVAVMTPVIVMYKDLDQEQPCLQCLILFFTPSTGGFPRKDNRFLWSNYGSFFFVISLLVSICAIMLFYTLSVRIVYCKLRKTNVWTDIQRRQVRDVVLRISCYILVFLFCWTPALTLAILDLSESEELSLVEYSWLFIMQGMTAPSQGFLNCIVYGWTKKSFRMAQHPDAATPMAKETYRYYGTAEGQIKYSAKPRRTDTPSPIPPASAESTLEGGQKSLLERQPSFKSGLSNSPSET